MQDEEMEVEQPSAKKSPSKHKESEKIFAGKVGEMQESSSRRDFYQNFNFCGSFKKEKSEHPVDGIFSENQSSLIFHRTRVCLTQPL